MTQQSQDFNDLYDQVIKIFGDGKITTERIIILTPRIVKFVQEIGTIKKLSGAEKKDLFLRIVRKVVSSAPKDVMTEEEKQNVLMFIDDILPTIVDAVVYAYKSDEFEKIKQKAKSFFAKCKCAGAN